MPGYNCYNRRKLVCESAVSLFSRSRISRSRVRCPVSATRSCGGAAAEAVPLPSLLDSRNIFRPLNDLVIPSFGDTAQNLTEVAARLLDEHGMNSFDSRRGKVVSTRPDSLRHGHFDRSM